MAIATNTTATSGKDLDRIIESRQLKKVAILGANGTMGFNSAALFTLGGLEVAFLARTKDKALAGLESAKSSVRSSTVAERAWVGSYDEDMEKAVAEADLIFEAIAEDFDLKNRIFEKVDAWRREDSIVATVSSGLSITKLAAPRSASFQKNFLGLHFFNPPNVIVGTELIAGEKTDPAVVDFIDAFCTRRLGRVMIRTSDTPAFAGNRVGFKVLNEVAQLAEEYGPVLMDRLVGPYTGRALTPLATIDLVGWDVHRAIVDNVYPNTNDEAHETNRLPDYMAKLIDGGTLGNKTGGGFFRLDTEPLALDPSTGNYLPVKGMEMPDLKFIDEIAFLHRIGEYEKAMQAFAAAEGDEARLAQKVIAGYISYAFCRAGEVTETITGIDLIMGCGFNWAPPSVLVDMIGLEKSVAMIETCGLTVPKILEQALKEGRTEPFFSDPRINIGKFFVAR